MYRIKMKFHTVYITTNLINNKKYIGKHSTNNINDDYLGSGKALQRAIKKYGKENFKKDILKIFDTHEEAYEYEKNIITEDIIEDSKYYNMKFGGCGAGLYKPKKKYYCNNGIKTIALEIDIPIPKGYVKGKLYSTTHDTFWVTNGIVNKLLKKDDLIPDGYKKGTTKNKKFDNMIWINDGKKSIRINKNDKIPNGYSVGMLVKPTTTGTFWVNNGKNNKLLKKDECIPSGYVKGRLINKDNTGKFTK